MQEKVKLGLIHGRFQPLHNGHMKYLLAGFEHAEHIVIGICTPEICTNEFAEQTGYPCTLRQNPYSYDERVAMIAASLCDAAIPSERFSFIPFPSDYKNISSLVSNDTVFFIGHTGALDSKKKEFLENLGYSTRIILLSDDTREESGAKIRESIANRDNIWKSMVPHAVKKFLENRV
ncbi:MAG: adenylyltransferase/cytidyltransferase family protein [bacterium]